jgi:O-antigen/teichoic acid export membrane protein
MESKLVQLSKKPFVRNVIIMATGTAAAQAVTMLLSPLITRLYGPEAFGLLGVFIAIVGITAPIAALTYPIAIVLPKNDKEAMGLVRLSLVIAFSISLIIAIILFCFKQPIVKLFKIESIGSFLYLIPLVILFSGFLQVAEQWLIRTKQFGIAAKVSFFYALILQGSQVILGLSFPLASVLLITSSLGHALRASLMIIGISRSGARTFNLTHKEPIGQLAKKYKDFPLYRAPEVLVNAISQSLPILLLTSFFGPASAGFYSIGITSLGLPSQLIGKSVGDVYYPRIAEAAKNGEKLTHLLKKSTLALGIIGIIPFGLVVIFGPWIFSLIFGTEWEKAGEYARWIALWSYFGFMNRPSVMTLPVLSAQAFHLKFTTFMLISRVIVLAFAYFNFKSDLIGIAFFGVSGAILNIFLILITIYKCKYFDKSQMKKFKQLT